MVIKTPPSNINIPVVPNTDSAWKYVEKEEAAKGENLLIEYK